MRNSLLFNSLEEIYFMETTNVEPRGSNVDFVWADEKLLMSLKKTK